MTKVKLLIPLLMLLLAACNGTGGTAVKNDPAMQAPKPYPEYVEYLFAAVQQHPDSVGLQLKLAAALDSAGAYKPALLIMDSLIAKDTANFGLWFTKGRIAENAGDTLLAMKSYDIALNIYPSADAMLALANLYAEQKNARSLLICTQVKRFSLGREYDAHADFISGIYNVRTGNREDALAYFDNCIANDYTYMEAYIEKGLVYYDNRQYREAMQVFTFASKVNALDADPYYWQGRCYEMLDIKDSALLRFKQALNLDKNSKEIKEALNRME